ncbi:hypothetical protein [Georgenia deserti]|uniref:DUF4244 domain-containing protein n=1 Tax=Georgenia deserti TaxID=2093781 RepID=A0ABW4KZB6_9MICO
MLTTLFTLLATKLGWSPQDDPERGDVPGWVLVTLMTAGLVVAIWAIAGPLLQQVFETAIQRVLDT